MSDISVRFGYVNTQDSQGFDRTEPSMGLFPANRSANPPVYAIPLSSAHFYTDSAYLLKSAFTAAEHFNMFPDRYTVNKIADTILSYMPELVTMKPFQAKQGKEIGEGTANVGGDIIHFGISDTEQVIL